MKKFKLFLAISPEEAGKEQNAIGAFIGELNDRYAPYGIYFQLTASGDCEEKSVEDEAGNSDLFYIIFHSETHEKALNAFDAAYDSFTRHRQPRIMTYFRQLDNDEPGQSILDFMERLDKELGHYYNHYTNVDTVKLNIVLQLQSLGLVGAELKIKKSALYLDDDKLMNICDVPIFYKNKQLAELQNEFAELDRKYWEFRGKQRKNPGDDELNSTVLDIVAKRKQAEDSISQLQTSILRIETFFVKEAIENGVTPRMKYARQSLEDGDVSAALEALALDDIVEKSERILERLETQKDALRVSVRELLLRAELLSAEIKNAGHLQDVLETLEQAARLEAAGGLERVATLQYVKLLRYSGQNEKALQYAEKCLNYLKETDTNNDSLLETLDLTAMINKDMNRTVEAEKIMEQTLELAQTLWKTEPVEYAASYAKYCANLAVLYLDTARSGKAAELLLKALDILRELPEENLLHNANNFTVYCDKLAGIYELEGRLEAFEEIYTEAIRLNDMYISKHIKDTENDTGTPELRLAFRRNNVYRNRAICGTRLAKLHLDSDRDKEAGEHLEYAEAIWDEMNIDDEESLTAAGAYYVETLYYMTKFYIKIGRRCDAEEKLIHAFFIVMLINALEPKEYRSWQETIFEELKSLHEDSYEPDSLKKQYNNAIDDAEGWLSVHTPEAYTRWLTDAQNTPSLLPEIPRRGISIEKLLLEKLEMYRRLSVKQPEIYDEEIAVCCRDLAKFYAGLNRNDEAEKLFLETENIYLRLAERNPARYKPCLRLLYKKIALFYFGIVRYDKGLKYNDVVNIIKKMYP